jgi:hypothetical protein
MSIDDRAVPVDTVEDGAKEIRNEQCREKIYNECAGPAQNLDGPGDIAYCLVPFPITSLGAPVDVDDIPAGTGSGTPRTPHSANR